MDTGAQKSVIGMKQAIYYCRYHMFELPYIPRRAKFRFADTLLPSKTLLHLFFPTPSGLKIIKADVVDADIPLLIGLDVLDEYGWNVLTVQNVLESVSEGWSMNLRRKSGHVIAPWDEHYDEFYSRAQLQKLHLHFMHLSNDKLFNLLPRAMPTQVDEETRSILKDILDASHACQTYSTKPITFQVRFPDEVVYNKEVRIDIMYLNGLAVLCIVDVGTNFISARFLTKVDTETIWNTFLYAWALLYSSFPRKMLTDQGSVFTSKEWRTNCEHANIILRHTGTESHNSLSSGETYHALIRRIFNKVSLTYLKESKELCLAFAVNAINDTAGHNGLVPSLLVFRMLPRLPIDNTDPLPLQERMKLMKSAHDEYEAILAEKRVDTALKKETPPVARLNLIPGQPVYVYWETPLKKWTGPHRLETYDNKRVLVDIGERTKPRHFNLAQVKPAKLPSISSLLPDSPLPFRYHTQDRPSGEQLKTSIPSSHSIQPLQLPPIQHLTSGSQSQDTPPFTTRNIRVMMTEVLDISDPRSIWFDDAKRKELEGLIKRGTSKLVLKEEIESDPNIVPSRFVLAIKRLDDGTELLKARFVLGGHHDREAKHSAQRKYPEARFNLVNASSGCNLWI